LLAKPVTRAHLLAGKFLGCWIATGLTLLVFYVFFGIVAGSREHSWPLITYLQALSLHWMMLGIVIALVVLGSVIFSAPSANVTIMFIAALFILLVGRHLNKVAIGLSEPASSLLYTLYFIIPHLEFFDLRNFVVHDWGAIRWGAWSLAMVYGTAYATLFLAIAWLSFRRKPLN
jgi:ABC-type transport system involved in multi-copper enzyme maturation permease subunit